MAGPSRWEWRWGFSHSGIPYFDAVQKNCSPWNLPYIGSISLILCKPMQTPYSWCVMLSVPFISPFYPSMFCFVPPVNPHFQPWTCQASLRQSWSQLRHLSLGPCSVFLDPGSNEMHMGDFLGLRCGRWVNRTLIGLLEVFRHVQTLFVFCSCGLCSRRDLD